MFLNTWSGLPQYCMPQSCQAVHHPRLAPADPVEAAPPEAERGDRSRSEFAINATQGQTAKLVTWCKTCTKRNSCCGVHGEARSLVGAVLDGQD